MRILDELLVTRTRGGTPPAIIQLLAGDLAEIPADHAVDALVVSAFPDSYTPNRGTLFESLRRRGLDMEVVAAHKQEDERARLGCWISERLPPPLIDRLHFERVICFEPQHPVFLSRAGLSAASLEDTVGFVFRCLNNFVLADGGEARGFSISRVAMPLLATGNQSVPVETMLPRLLEAAIFWLEGGLPLTQLKIVAYSEQDARVAARLFAIAKGTYAQRHQPGDGSVAFRGARTVVESTPALSWETRLAQTVTREVVQACTRHVREQLTSRAEADERALLDRLFARIDRDAPQNGGGDGDDGSAAVLDHDVFVSYAHKQGAEVEAFVGALRAAAPDRRIFYDRTAITPGQQWIKALSDALQHARTFIAVLSPDYTASPVCWDEFQCAKLAEYTTRQSIIKTVRLYSEPSLPPIMGIYSYVDCAEGDVAKLQQSAAALMK